MPLLVTSSTGLCREKSSYSSQISTGGKFGGGGRVASGTKIQDVRNRHSQAGVAKQLFVTATVAAVFMKIAE